MLICVWTHTGKERERIKAWEQKICFLHLRECMIPTENISLTHEHYDLCVLPRPRSQPCWYLHVEFPSNLGNKMVPPDWLPSPPYKNLKHHITLMMDGSLASPKSSRRYTRLPVTPFRTRRIYLATLLVSHACMKLQQ